MVTLVYTQLPKDRMHTVANLEYKCHFIQSAQQSYLAN